MRKVLILALLMALSPVTQANPLKCGLKPTPPINCDSKTARCVCDRYGKNCQWVFDC